MKRTLAGAFALVLGVTALAGCAPAELPKVKESQVSTTDAVLAIRLSNNAGTGAYDLAIPDGYLLLIKEDGTGTALEIGEMVTGHPLWNDAGLTVSTREDELLIDDQGLTRTPRGLMRTFEVNRFPTTDGRGFMAFYSGDGIQSVFKGDEHGNLEHTDNDGMFISNGHCGDRVLSATSTALSPELASAAHELAEKMYQDGRLNEPVPAGSELDILVQVYPHQGGKATLMGTTQTDWSMEPGPWYFTCYQDVVYVPAFQQEHPDASPVNGLDPRAGKLVLHAWDLKTGQRTLTPVTMPDGSLAPITRDESGSETGHMNGPIYTMVTQNGEVLSLDVTTGVLKNRFQIPLTDISPDSKFIITDTDVYALDVPRDISKPLTLTRYDLESGQPHHLMTINGTGYYQDGSLLTGPVWVQAIALRPSYLKQITR